MDTARKRALLYKHIRSGMRSDRESAVNRILGREKLPTVGQVDYYEVLGKYLTSEDALYAFQRVVDDLSQGLLHGIFCVLDGATAVTDFYQPALIDRDTKQDLAPEDSTYHDEFFDYLLDQGDELGV
ncbi:MAG TPA: hypothetical protein VMX94_00545 [Armatimonadota bacterium]|nr:hypothetical protein [Armatimonadota bacterium]